MSGISMRTFTAHILGVFLLILVGCSRHDKTFLEQKRITDASNQLDRDYLQGDVNRARDSLEKNAELLEKGKVLEAYGRSILLDVVYSRLYVLEKRVGNNAAAEASLIKQRFWSLNTKELSGEDTEHAVAEVDEMDSGKLFDLVNRVDEKENGGRVAAYVESLRK